MGISIYGRRFDLRFEVNIPLVKYLEERAQRAAQQSAPPDKVSPQPSDQSIPLAHLA